MNSFEEHRKKKISEIIAINKLIIILLCGIIIFTNTSCPINNNPNSVNLLYILCLAFIFLLIYWIWIMFCLREYNTEKIKWIQYIENYIFVAVTFGIIIATGANKSNYKFIFLFIIINSTIQFGMKYGITLACICSAILLCIDLVYARSLIINKYFENDLILVGLFLLTAWPLGYYRKIENEYIKDLAYLVNVDGLTELYNHRFFYDNLKMNKEKCENENKPLSLIIMDIDYFKSYNDLNGHQMGDEVLKIIGRILKESLSDDEIACRYGGEELTIILPNKDEEYALNLAENIRKRIEMYKFKGEESQPNKKITVSIGVSTFPDKAKNENELVSSADDALYRAKFFNKNRVECYYSVLEELKRDIEEEHIDLITSIKTLISVINAKDRYTYAHVERVVIYSKLLGNKLNLSEVDKKILMYGAYMHDIGKINISKEILNKRMPLSVDEWNILKMHPKNGAEMIESVESLKSIIPIILYHHERYDGKGYPEGLKGEEIPYLSRVLTVVDSFDAMTSNRPYNKRKSCAEGIIELKRCSSTQFDPKIAQAFIEVIEENYGKFDNLAVSNNI
ncbi:bifunctional diguanylate cyclase/phosphohydrolase [Clostridium lundense]|uniref:bifunctional diguanylate cyclase/phosphohydrolase n=1 Tax=Clostridium lundense TaxID=319475 RepID=UPI000483C35C|nr:diguanylate cyclase [Clostridium lundense]